VGSKSEKGIDQVVADIKNAVTYAEREKEIADPLKAKFATINQTAALNQKFEQLGTTEKGADLVREEISSLFVYSRQRQLNSRCATAPN
jgi:hypothetical protein